MKQQDPADSDGSTVIRADEVYQLGEFTRRVGFSRVALTAARKRGLPTCRVGKRVFVRGSDWMAFLASRATTKA